jgi:hypothetical protein
VPFRSVGLDIGLWFRKLRARCYRPSALPFVAKNSLRIVVLQETFLRQGSVYATNECTWMSHLERLSELLKCPDLVQTPSDFWNDARAVV